MRSRCSFGLVVLPLIFSLLGMGSLLARLVYTMLQLEWEVPELV